MYTAADVADAMAVQATAADAKAATAVRTTAEIAVADATKIQKLENVAFAGIRVCDASRLL